jgi:hypothetical protein
MRSLREMIMGLGRHGSGGLVRQDCTVSGPQSPTAKRAKCRIEMLDAMNGRVLEVATRADERDDWEIDLYIVRDDETLADAIATMLVLRGGK